MSIEEAREKVMIPMSDTDIHNYGIRMILYSDLANYENITDLLQNDNDAVIILVRTEINYGHFIAVIRDKKTINFFDSYGFRPDKLFYKTPEYMRDKLNQEYPHMSYLLNKAIDDGFKVSFNSYDFQKKKDESNTCGRWCVWIINYFKITKNPTINKFVCHVLQKSKELNNIDLNILVSMVVP
jgi:hypothetical protein